MRLLNLIHILILVLITNTAIAQDNMPTVPTAIFVGNAAFHAPVYGAKVALVLQEDFDNEKRPVSTFIGEYTSDTAGAITVSLIPDKSYLVTTTKDGFYTQLSKIKTTNFSRTHKNKKGISLRPRNVLAIKGNIAIPSGTKGEVTLINKTTNYNRTEIIDENGDYNLPAIQGDDYQLHVFVEGMIDTVVDITKDKLVASTANVPFVYNFIPNAPQPNFHEGDVFALETYNLKFIDRTHRLSSEIWMDTLASILGRNPDVKMEMQIHTDSRKSDRINYYLAKKRAQAIKLEFEERGISSEQYFFEIKGEDEILNHCVDGEKCSKQEHAINNRVVMLVNKGKFLFKED